MDVSNPTTMEQMTKLKVNSTYMKTVFMRLDSVTNTQKKKKNLPIPGMITSTSRLEIVNDVWGVSLLKEILLWSCQHGRSPVSTRSQEDSYQPSTSEGNVYIHKQYSFKLCVLKSSASIV